MSEAITIRGQQTQGRNRLYFHPPHPWLALRLHTGTLLILPRSFATHALERFQINPHGCMVEGVGAYQLSRLNAADWDTVWTIRDFYNDTQHGGAAQLRDPQMIAWLQSQVRDGWFAAFWFQGEPELGQAVMHPAEVAPVPPPAVQAVAQWSIRHKIITMFQAVPKHLSGAAKAQFEAFLTPENLALLAGFFVLVAAVQAAPLADAVVDAILTGLAWAMYGWAGLVATRDLVQAVIGAARAKNQADIDQAAQEAASAVLVLGVTLFLKRLADRVKVENSTGPKGAEPELPARATIAKKSTGSVAATPIRTPELRSDLSDNWFDADTGKLVWPPDNGFLEPSQATTLPEGTILDRYGKSGGSFLSPAGTPFEARALPYDPDAMQYNVYEVLKPLSVQVGQAAPWFDQSGLGTQYMTSESVKSLVQQGFLRAITP